MTGPAFLTPAQQRTLAMLRRGDEPLVFEADVVDELRTDAAEALAELASRLDAGTELTITKHLVATVMECEAQFLAPDDFTWSAARARGQVAHKAIQLMLNWKAEIVPAELVNEAIARLELDERGLGSWLEGVSPAERADLRSQAVDHVTKFLESFPPLDTRSRPVTESLTQWPVQGPIVLRGKADLTIGTPQGRESRKVIVDLKSGRTTARHRDDLRFYALIETLSRDVPPRRLASMYLDAAEPIAEDVTTGLLRSALRRTLDAIDKVIELRIEGREPKKVTGPGCRWCTVLSTCSEGRDHLAGLTEER